ncbi:MAG: type II toxin-antitoxin system VapC family toxin [Armatimonadota bacterium]
MIVMGTSGCITILADAPNADAFDARISRADVVIVPTPVLYEVYKITSREHSSGMADRAGAQLRTHRIADLTHNIALVAVDASLAHGLAMADAVVYATAQTHRATLVTGDEDFRELPGVEFIPLEDT